MKLAHITLSGLFHIIEKLSTNGLGFIPIS
jgi:hypothetical protein